MSEQVMKTAWLRDADWQCVRSLANLWLWGWAIDAGVDHPNEGVFWVYPEHLANCGPNAMKGKRIRVSISIEDHPPMAGR